MVIFDEKVTKQVADTIEYYTEYADLEEIPIDFLRCMYKDSLYY